TSAAFGGWDDMHYSGSRVFYVSGSSDARCCDESLPLRIPGRSGASLHLQRSPNPTVSGESFRSAAGPSRPPYRSARRTISRLSDRGSGGGFGGDSQPCARGPKYSDTTLPGKSNPF